MNRVLTAAVVALLASQVHAAPADYKDKLPEDVSGMKRMEVSEDQGNLIAFYGETIGRATVTIMPAPSPADGESGFDGSVVSGKTVAAQRVLLRAVEQNLEAGTKALGDKYDTSMPRFEPVTMNDEAGKVLMELSCASLLRRNPEGGAEPVALLDRLCVAAKGDEVILQRVTTPLAMSDTDKVNNEQLAFIGELTDRLTGATAK